MITTKYLEEGTRKRRIQPTENGNNTLVNQEEFQKLVDYIKTNVKKARKYFNWLVSQETITFNKRDVWVVPNDFELVHLEIDNFMWEFDGIDFDLINKEIDNLN